MLKIEVIKFEAMDIITASTAAPCNHEYEPINETYTDDSVIVDFQCQFCGDTYQEEFGLPE